MLTSSVLLHTGINMNARTEEYVLTNIYMGERNRDRQRYVEVHSSNFLATFGNGACRCYHVKVKYCEKVKITSHDDTHRVER